MKTLKCPLCGKPLEFFQELKIGEMGRVGCSFCEWTTFLATPHKAWEAAEELISKYPPLMRVRAGDNLKLVHRDDILTVMDKDLVRGKLYLENCCGDVELSTLDAVDKWPWELEKGMELKRKLAKAIEQGSKDWADVPDATQWVEQMRGHEEETGKEGK